MRGDVLTVERVVPAPPEAIFALVANTTRHAEIDGSGTVMRPKAGTPERLSLGATFVMSMKIAGIGYSMVNNVIEFEEDRRIAWQARPPGLIGRFTGGQIWRYEFEPVDGGTRARESWDLSQDGQRTLLKFSGMPTRMQRAMEKSLERIERLLGR